MRNLLGRLNARKPDDLQRIARYWEVPLVPDRGRQVGTLYRTMSDLRAARTVMSRLDAAERQVVHELISADEGALTITALANRTGLDETETREIAIRLFRNGILARDGDSQDLPVGALPKLFLPRELGLIFRRVEDEIAAGDVSANPLRVILQTMDAGRIEEVATRWGINVVPGLRSRDDLIGQILRQVSPDRIRRLVGNLSSEAKRIWRVFEERSVGGALALDDVLAEAGLDLADGNPRTTESLREALDQLETSLLALHTYTRSGERALFVPEEILHPTQTPATIPLQPLEPLDEGAVQRGRERVRHALAWDLLTVLREIANHGAPVWVPGEPVSRSWQRRLNSRLWYGGEEQPAEGYLGFLLYLGLQIGLLQRTPPPPGTHADRNAIVPVITPMIREWRSRSFAEQSARLRRVWLGSDAWIEARERGDVDVWGPDWKGFRRKLLESVVEMDPDHWFLLRDLAQHLAESDPALIGTSMTIASPAAGDSGGDRERSRISATAHIIRLEFETALTWFSLVESGRVAKQGRAVRVTDFGVTVAGDPDLVDEDDAGSGAALKVTEGGLVTVLRPTPLHLWSMSAFADAESVASQPVYQLRSGSVGRALGAGFDMEQIETYLERNSGGPLPEKLKTSLREWTAGYRRVRLRRAIVLTPDLGASREDLERVVFEAGLELVEGASEGDAVHALFPPGDTDGAAAEEALLAALRAAGFLGQWAGKAATPRQKGR